MFHVSVSPPDALERILHDLLEQYVVVQARFLTQGLRTGNRDRLFRTLLDTLDVLPTA